MSPTKLALRIALAAAIALVIAQVAGRVVIDALMMPLASITDTLSAAYTAQLSWQPDATDMVRITAQLFDGPLALAPLGIGNGAEVKAAIHVEHMLLPVVLLYTVLGAWPQPDGRRRIVVMLAGVPGALLAVALTTPFLLAGKIEMLLLERSAAMGVPRAEPGILRWMLFTEGGGRWLLAIVLAFVILIMVDILMPARDVANGPGLPCRAARDVSSQGSNRRPTVQSKEPTNPRF